MDLGLKWPVWNESELVLERCKEELIRRVVVLDRILFSSARNQLGVFPGIRLWILGEICNQDKELYYHKRWVALEIKYTLSVVDV